MPSLDETLNNPLVQKVATAAVTKIVGDNATSVATQNLPQANATLNAANAIAGIAQIGTGIATTIAGVRDENQRAKFTQNLQLLTLSQQETLEKLKAIVKPFVKNEEAFQNLTEETDFINDLQINSANLVDIVLDTEEAFNIEIDNQSMEKMLTIRAALEIINSKLAEK